MCHMCAHTGRCPAACTQPRIGRRGGVTRTAAQHRAHQPAYVQASLGCLCVCVCKPCNSQLPTSIGRARAARLVVQRYLPMRMWTTALASQCCMGPMASKVGSVPCAVTPRLPACLGTRTRARASHDDCHHGAAAAEAFMPCRRAPARTPHPCTCTASGYGGTCTPPASRLHTGRQACCRHPGPGRQLPAARRLHATTS